MANEILYGQSIDMDDLQILNFVAHSSPTAPTNVGSLGGMMWWKSDSYDLRVYNDDDSLWNSLVQGPAASTDLNIPVWNGTLGNKLSDGLGLVTTLGTPGSDTNIVSEQGIREAITSITISSLGDIADVTITAITNNEMLVWETDHWENQTAAENNLATFDGSSITGRVPYWSNITGLLNDGYSITTNLNVDSGPTYLIRSDAIINGFPTNFVRFQTGASPTESEGTTWWNSDDKTLNIATGLGPVLQVGQERYLKVYNNTGGILYNGQIVATDGTLTGGVPNVILAKADSFTTCFSLSMLTQDIAPGTWGFATRDGHVHGLDTSLLSLGAVWLSATVAGGYTQTKPEFPNYEMIIGGVSKIGSSDGIITVSRYGSPGDTIYNFWNGTFRESFSFTVSSNGTVITGTLAPTNGNVDMTAMFSDGLAIVDTSPSATIVLTAGTDDVPQMNYIYVPKSTKVLTVSTSNFPSEEHVRVATVYLRSAATTQTEDALKNHNWNDHVQSTDGQGHLSHLGQKLRKFEAQWESGCELTAVLRTVPNPDELYVTVTGGQVFQMHPQTIKSFDTEASDVIHVWNHFTTPFLSIQDLATQTLDSLGNTLANKHFSVVIWGSAASAGEPAHIFMNLPTGSYNSAVQALADPNNLAIYNIPLEFSGTGFLIARLVLSFSGGTSSLTVVANEDLRGKIPNTSAGGGSIGGAGVTTYLGLTDSPIIYTGDALKAVRINAGETALEHTSSLNLDTINEWTLDAGVTVEGVEMKDNNLTTVGTISSTNAATGQSTISLGLVVNNSSSALAIADTAINTTTYTALAVDASNDSIVMMSNALGKIGFFGAAATVQSTGWTVTNHIADKIIDANATTIDEIVDVLGELITELKLKGILGG
jgi:hypothetical protein